MPRRNNPPVKHAPDDRSPLALAYGWAVRITAISLEMAVPGLIGLWIDRKLGTVMVFLLLGVIVGVTAGTLHLVRLAASLQRDESADQKPSHHHRKQ
jgi:F0F1-type ATP synthase assembly protein I